MNVEPERQGPAPFPHQNLPPRDYAQFVGRQKELAELRRLLQPYPKSRAYVITIDGIGGIGKSALALETASIFRDQYHSLPEAERFEAIVWVSAKRSYLSADGIVERRQTFRTLDDLYIAIAQVLDYPAITRAKAEEQRAIVEDVLREQRTLLILDNLETVDDEELLSFLRELPDPTKAIVTTRHRIDVAHPVRLTGMPHDDALVFIAQEIARKDVQLTGDQHEALWQRTGGVPLAIVWSIGLIGLGSSVESVLHRLGSGQSDIARFCFEESVKHIRGRDAHKLLMALALFAVDASREAVGVVAELGDDEFGRDIGLEELLRLSLINKEGERLSLLPLTRSFVQAEIAQQSVSVEQAERRLWEYYAQFVRQLKGFWRDWGKYDQFERDLANCFRIIDALAASILYTENELGERMIAPDSRGRAEQLTEMIDIMARVCRLRGYWSEYERISYIAIPLSHQLNQIAMVGWRYRDLGRINYVRGDTGLAKKLTLEALSIAKQTRQRLLLNESRMLLGLIAIQERNFEEARQLMTEVLQEYSATTAQTTIPNFKGGLGLLAEQQGDLSAALVWYREAIDLARTYDELPDVAANVLGLGRVMFKMADLDTAALQYAESLRIATACGAAEVIGRAHYQLAALRYSQHQAMLAESSARQALDLFRRLGMKREQAEAEALLAGLSAADA